MNSLNRDQYKEVDERFDNLTTKYFEYGKAFEIPICMADEDELVVKSFLHSELERKEREVREEMAKKMVILQRQFKRQ